MEIKKAVGRNPKVTYRTVIILADALQHNSSVTEACRFVGISRVTYYRYFNNNQVFSEKMIRAKENQNKVVFSFVTVW